MASRSFTKAALMVSLLINGSLVLFAVERAADADSMHKRAKQLEADVRAQIGKRYDLEEKHLDELEAARSEGQVDLWKTQQALQACERGDKK